MFLTIDLSLVTLVLMMNAVGYWIKKTSVASWPVPLTVIEIFLSVMFSTGWGWYLGHCHGVAALISSFLSYGLPNGLVVGFVAVNLYDIVHGFAKKKEEWKALAFAFLSFFQKKEKEAKK